MTPIYFANSLKLIYNLLLKPFNRKLILKFSPLNIGSCVNDKGKRTSLGLLNDVLHVNETGSPYLLYENGDKCNSNSSANWTTKIEFVCAKDSHITIQPKIIETSNCQLLIQYPTPLACQNQIKCASNGYGPNDEGIDLSLLMSTTKNYEVDGKDGKKVLLIFCWNGLH